MRLRPRNNEDLASDVDFADCVELQPEVIVSPIFWFLVKHLSVLFL